MGSSFRLTLVTILALVLVVGLALFGSSRLTTHAAGTTLKLSMKPGGASSPSTTSCGSWNIVPSPNVGSGDNTLEGIITASTNNIWTVGSYYNDSDHKVATLIEHWDGTHWSVVSSPNHTLHNDILNSVAAVSASNIWAVGEDYNKTSKGLVYRTLIEHWDGTHWSVVSSPNPSSNSTLFRVAVVSARNIWAVGYDYPDSGPSQPLIEHWNGSQWSIVPTPNIPGSLQGIKVISARNIWAVGEYTTSSYGQALIERWDGSQWSIVPSPNVGSGDNFLGGVKPISASDIWAVGSDSGNQVQTLIEHWDGSQWSIIPSPNVGSGDNILTGVARDATTNQIWAAGYYWNANKSSYQTLIEFYC